MNMLNDKELLEWYWKGWNDELDGTTSTIENKYAIKAYKLGALHAYVGDDVTSIDLLSNAEILDMIKQDE